MVNQLRTKNDIEDLRPFGVRIDQGFTQTTSFLLLQLPRTEWPTSYRPLVQPSFCLDRIGLYTTPILYDLRGTGTKHTGEPFRE